MHQPPCSGCTACGPKIGRRGFLQVVGASALALQMDALDFASSLFGAQAPPGGRPVIHVAFVRPQQTPIVSWPGGQTDVAAQQALFAQTLSEAAAKLDVQLQARTEPLENREQIDQYLTQFQQAPADGLLVCAMELGQWADILHLAQNRGDVPLVIYSNMTSFTGHMLPTRQVPGTYVGATPDVSWLAFGLRMLGTIWRMKHTRLVILAGTETREVVVPRLGTTLRYLPAARFDEELAQVAATDEVRAMADAYAQAAQEIVEPQAAEILDAAKNYVVCKRIMEAEQCQGLAFACLGRSNPVCMAFSRLLDEGVVAGCEADVNAALSMLLTQLLFGRSGFIQDPSANTVSNTLIGAHCTSPTKLEGFAQPYRAPYKLRCYHTGTGASMQVLWPEGREVTVMQFAGPDQMILGSGRVVSNIAQPPSGCCRTAVEITVEGVADTDACKGFHQLFVLGSLERAYRAYCQLAGVEVVHI